MHPRNRRFRTGFNARQHRCEPTGIVDVPVERGFARALHPLHVGTRRKMFACPGQNDDPDRAIVDQRSEGLVHLGNHRLVEGIEDFGA